ncbi:MAG: ABC transporter ATP-binding protein [Candidatus Izemoplasmatales bacterium]|nr:ABC transporter ATP-binding protein [Candidatus Izemoplasmatales bacterium]
MIKVNDLEFSYTKNPYMKDLSFEVNDGEIFGFLGPSGAGKSTLQKILTGVLSNYKGSVVVNNTEVKQAKANFYENIGVDFEFPSLYEKLTALENLKFFASLYSRTQDISKLIESVGLQFDANKKVMDYSKGMKSRLNFIKALLHNPQIIFLDEPTSGLDPTNAKIIKDIILQEKAKGKTIILTTHNMYDATELCDRVAFIVDGKIRIIDTPRNLIMSRKKAIIEYSYFDNDKELTSKIALNETGSDNTLRKAISNNQITSIHSSEPSLNDIFIEVTGRTLE